MFLGTVKRESLIPNGAGVTAAVSGGADSMAMLYLLHRFAPARKWNIEVLHIDHGIRASSGEDAAFVAEACERLVVPCRIEKPEAVSCGSLESGWSLVRHRLYVESGKVVAVAHTRSDRAETLLLRLVEGSGLRGLGGMDYHGRGPVVRPMLDLHRDQVREFLSERRLPWREDVTNQDQSAARNRIRASVMPVLEEHFPEAADGLSRSSAVLAAWRDLQAVVAEAARNPMPRAEYTSLPEVMRLSVLWSLAGQPRSGADELFKTDAWVVSGGTGEHILPGGHLLLAGSDALSVKPKKGRYY
ncbi:MAG: tRNA lysidine(34) synthetase TilS [Candidatus Fermentibacteraceae bacterium]